MFKATEQIYEALSHLRGNPDFNTVIGWFRQLQAAEDIELRHLKETHYLQSQGKAQLLEYILSEIHNAPENYSILKTNKLREVKSRKEIEDLKKADQGRKIGY